MSSPRLDDGDLRWYIPSMREVWVLAARRTPIGRFLGSFAETPAAELGAVALRAALADAPLPPGSIQEVIFGCARQAGNGPNLARQVVRRAGLPDEVPAFTVNKACASSLKALTLGALSIAAGEQDVIAVGGTESMSRVPFLLERGRSGYRLGNGEVLDGMYRDGFLCPLCGQLMGETAENLADRYSISREEQDRYAVESQSRCEKARAANRFVEEIAAVGEMNRDEHPRDGVTLESMKKLPSVFRKDGTVHAGNSSGITDGAAALLLSSADRARSLGLRPLARVVDWTVAGVDPRSMGIGPVPALHALEKKTGVPLAGYDLVELNEAFAAQVIACDRELHFDWNRTNVNGGSIALGHPIGATGARICVTLLHEMKRRNARRGLATLCVSGGLGMAVAFERVPE